MFRFNTQVNISHRKNQMCMSGSTSLGEKNYENQIYGKEILSLTEFSVKMKVEMWSKTLKIQVNSGNTESKCPFIGSLSWPCKMHNVH